MITPSKKIFGEIYDFIAEVARMEHGIDEYNFVLTLRDDIFDEVLDSYFNDQRAYRPGQLYTEYGIVTFIRSRTQVEPMRWEAGYNLQEFLDLLHYNRSVYLSDDSFEINGPMAIYTEIPK